MKTLAFIITLLACAKTDVPIQPAFNHIDATEAVVQLAKEMVEIDEDYLPLLTAALEAKTTSAKDGKIKSKMWTIDLEKRAFTYQITWPNVTVHVFGEFVFDAASQRWVTKLVKQQTGRPVQR